MGGGLVGGVVIVRRCQRAQRLVEVALNEPELFIPSPSTLSIERVMAIYRRAALATTQLMMHFYCRQL